MSKNKSPEIDFSWNDEGDSTPPLFSPGTDAFPSKNAMEPMTIFYNKKVNVYFLPRRKAEKIMRWVDASLGQVNISPKKGGNQRMSPSVLDNLKRDMPLTRKKSLETFLLRRKARLRLENPRPTSPHESSNVNVHSDERSFVEREK